MQLEDVERLEKLRDARDEAVKMARDLIERRSVYMQSFSGGATAMHRAYEVALLASGPALLALAREALERRRDVAAGTTRIVRKPWLPSEIVSDYDEDAAQINAEAIAKCSRETRDAD